MLFPPGVLDNILKYLEFGPFWKSTGSQGHKAEQMNRHGIAHGISTGFETEAMSLKYLALLDAFSYILLHDKMLAGTI